MIVAERWYHYYDGNDANDGLSPNSPRKLIPGQSGATSVAAGDIINIRNGVDFSAGGRISTPAFNNLTYRGYGLADNVLSVRQPARFAPWVTLERRVVREPGVHEGAWVLRGDAIATGSPILIGQGRSGMVFEDFQILGADLGTARHAVEVGGTTVTNGSGTQLRRFAINGAGKSGLFVCHNSVTIEEGRIENVREDCITLRSGSTFNSSRSGSVDVMRRLHLSEPNVNQSTGIADGAVGDLIQMFPSNVNDYGGNTLIEDIYGFKSSYGKQAFVFHDATGGITARRLHLTGNGSLFIMLSHLRGAVLIEDFFINGEFCAPDAGFAFVRFDAIDSGAPAYGWDTGSSVRVRRGHINARRVPGLLRTAWNFTSAHTFDGLVEVENVTVAPSINDAVLATQIGESVIASFALRSHRCTYGDNFVFRARNNRLGTTGAPHVTLPTGMENTGKMVFAGNSVAAANFTIGDTSYADVAAFQAAHDRATGNRDDDPLTTASGIPLSGSPLLQAGVDLGYLRDIRGFQSRKHIGAYGPARLRY